jgi:hypothetical protein
MYIAVRAQYQLFLPDFDEIWTDETWIFLCIILEKYAHIKFHKVPSSGSELFQADGRTDMTELIDALRNFTKA